MIRAVLVEGLNRRGGHQHSQVLKSSQKCIPAHQSGSTRCSLAAGWMAIAWVPRGSAIDTWG